MAIEDWDEPEVIVGSREQLLHLLAEAAEIEHTLMCSYLYAAFSLKRPHEHEFTPEEAAAVEAWQKAIMKVAVEEMGHLLMVANLTVAVGGRPHFARPNFPISPGYFPSGVVVRLTPFSMETLDHFIHLERPRGAEGVDAASFQADDYSRDQARQSLMPGGQDYETIGHLYDAIRANLVALHDRFGQADLFLADEGDQVAGELIRLDHIIAIADLPGAEHAIDLIVEQGEGGRADREISHYRSFLEIRQAFEILQAANADFAPAWPAACNPLLRRPVEPGDAVWIDAPEAASLLDFGCAAYGILLRLIVQCFARRGDNRGADQRQLLEAAFVLMHAVGEAGGALARLPASPSASGLHAGMTFTMLRGVEPLLSGRPEARLFAEQVRGLALGARAHKLDCAERIAALTVTFPLLGSDRGG